MSQLVSAGRTLLSPFISTGRWYNETAKAHPLATGVITSGLKTSAADFFAQKVIEGKKEMDWTRHAVFCTFGFAYLGGFQYYLYNVKFTQWCAPITARFGHKAVAPIKVFIDQGIHHPFLYFPVFFSMKAIVSGQPLSTAVEKYKTEIWDSVKALWGVWVPLQLINFAFVPRHMRIPAVAGISFGWTVILSVMQGKFDAAKQVGAVARPAAVSGVNMATAVAATTGGKSSPMAAHAVVENTRSGSANAPLHLAKAGLDTDTPEVKKA
jgi:protein Mpv17